VPTPAPPCHTEPAKPNPKPIHIPIPDLVCTPFPCVHAEYTDNQNNIRESGWNVWVRDPPPWFTERFQRRIQRKAPVEVLPRQVLLTLLAMDSLGDSMSEYDNDVTKRAKDERSERNNRSERLAEMKLTPSELVKQAWQLKKLPLDKLIELGKLTYCR
jgi:hypothetical protein